ncbi:glycosyltransferase family 4 protein [Providencia rettgeri]|uniref:glycosyltransferase family 4 protein n=1 Tax=Providencia rettgeri TaxID=587 RepID=UPI002882879B|nr:glycosyltransferase family 4 protein [Providencia rettgeri]ELM3938422.1 glycosyltransferase family 4 protein [Providencia rettgeri]EMA4646044.1 glycosyltransferase family 4 protein [Providencia rettgeri]MDK3110057.1 glycosyltransferase family 4 protein [Providencia rettgeri]WRR97111.1 glycosyltransferase family 4 protein [Providencia rettgeri]
MKKISFLIDDITLTGGTERVTCLLSNELSSRNYNITIYSLGFSQKKIKYELNDNISIKNYSKKNKIFSLCKILKMTKRENETLIVISMGKLSTYVAFLSYLKKPKHLIFSEHISFESFSYLKKLVKKLAYTAADHVVFLTEHDKNIVNMNKSKYLYIENMNSFHNSNFNISNYSSRDNIAIAVGRYGYQKNFELLIELWKKANIPNWQLFIIGQGTSPLKKLINNNDHIEIYTETDNIQNFYNKAKLILMTSRYEGLPMVLIEAMHFSIPAISFDCKTGPKEIIQHNHTGFIIEYENNAKFVETLKRVTKETTLLTNMSVNSKTQSERYSAESIMKKWINLINF